MSYTPEPIDTSKVELGGDIRQLTEHPAKNAHDVWAQQRMAEDWRHGPSRDDQKKEHPCLVPYEQLPESEKEYHRSMAMKTLKAIIASGYQISKQG